MSSFLDPGDHLSQKSDPRDPMDAAFVDESHVAVPISPEFASIVASDMKDSIDANLAGKRTEMRHLQGTRRETGSRHVR